MLTATSKESEVLIRIKVRPDGPKGELFVDSPLAKSDYKADTDVLLATDRGVAGAGQSPSYLFATLVGRTVVHATPLPSPATAHVPRRRDMREHCANFPDTPGRICG